MCRFSMPAAMKYEDKVFVYEHLYGLKKDPKSGLLGKASYHLWRVWIHLTGGRVVKDATTNIANLTSEQKAIILVTLHRNPKRYTQHAYTTAFLKAIRENLINPYLVDSDLINKKNANLVRSCAAIGDHILLEKVLELKPKAKVTSQYYSGHGYNPLMCAAIVGDVESAKLLLNKGANINEQDPSARGRTLLEMAVDSSEEGKNKDGIFNFLSEKFDRETIVKTISSSNGLERLSVDVYKEVLPTLNLTQEELASLIYQENQRANSDKMPFFLELVLAKPEAESDAILKTCSEKFNSKIKSHQSWQSISSNPFDRIEYDKWIKEEKASSEKLIGLIETARAVASSPQTEANMTDAA